MTGSSGVRGAGVTGTENVLRDVPVGAPARLSSREPGRTAPEVRPHDDPQGLPVTDRPDAAGHRSTARSDRPAGPVTTATATSGATALGGPAFGVGRGEVIHLPSVRHAVRHAGTHIAEGVLVPALTFYLVLSFVSLRWALIAALLWSYTVIVLRVGRHKRIPGVVLMGAGLLTVRTVIAFAANSSFLYFMQPSLGNFCIAALFLASLVPGRPLVRRLADDFCSFPASLDAHPHVKTFFVRLTILWAAVCAANGACSLLLLLHESIGSFLALRSVVSYGLVISGTAVSYLWFRRTMRGSGIRIVFGPAAA